MISIRLSTIITASFFLLLLGATAYLDSFYLKNKDVSTFSISSPTDESDDEATIKQTSESVVQPPILEYKLVDTDEVDGYIIEIYREFEIYKDQNGKILESIPTSNYNYLRYKQE